MSGFDLWGKDAPEGTQIGVRKRVKAREREKEGEDVIRKKVWSGRDVKEEGQSWGGRTGKKKTKKSEVGEGFKL